MPADISKSVSDDIRSSFTINGAIPLTTRDITERFDSFKNDILNRLTVSMIQNIINATPYSSSIGPSDSEWDAFQWDDGKIDQIDHFVSLDWRVPTY